MGAEVFVGGGFVEVHVGRRIWQTFAVPVWLTVWETLRARERSYSPASALPRYAP